MVFFMNAKGYLHQSPSRGETERFPFANSVVLAQIFQHFHQSQVLNVLLGLSLDVHARISHEIESLTRCVLKWLPDGVILALEVESEIFLWSGNGLAI